MGLQIASGASFLRALASAREADITSSLLARGKNGVLAALEAAAERGARIRVRLESAPYDPSGSGGRLRANVSAAAEMRRHGIDAELAQSDPEAPMHLKAAVLDGRVFLDDRNWLADGRDTIVETSDAGDAAAVRAAMRGEQAPAAGIAVRKREALALEADTIRHSGSSVAVESESFGSSVVADALLERAEAGEAVRLLVSSSDIRGEREVQVLERLSAAGAQVRVESGDRNEKLCVAEERAWVGSANATAGFPSTVDWGAQTDAAPMVDALRATFERNWAAGRPYAGGVAKPVDHGVQ